MSPTYRCPVDDRVFDTENDNTKPSSDGHSECPGPHCNERRQKGAAKSEGSESKPQSAQAASSASSGRDPESVLNALLHAGQKADW